MDLLDEIRVETEGFIDNHYPGRGGVKKLARELSPLTGRDERTEAQMFGYYRGQDGGRTPDRFYLYYLTRLNHPVKDWARACLSILAKHGKGLPTAE